MTLREEFDARFPVPSYVFWCSENQHYMSSGNPLACIGYRGMWDGWKASRESLKPVEYCSKHGRCLCGGDTEGVRRTCDNWVKV